jgi:hypothetical protein
MSFDYDYDYDACYKIFTDQEGKLKTLKDAFTLGMLVGMSVSEEPKFAKPEEEPLINGDGSLYNTTLKVAGKPYRCECGCNVFHHPDKTDMDLYQCNGCDNRFSAA